MDTMLNYNLDGYSVVLVWIGIVCRLQTNKVIEKVSQLFGCELVNLDNSWPKLVFSKGKLWCYQVWRYS